MTIEPGQYRTVKGPFDSWPRMGKKSGTRRSGLVIGLFRRGRIVYRWIYHQMCPIGKNRPGFVDAFHRTGIEYSYSLHTNGEASKSKPKPCFIHHHQNHPPRIFLHTHPQTRPHPHYYCYHLPPPRLVFSSFPRPSTGSYQAAYTPLRPS